MTEGRLVRVPYQDLDVDQRALHHEITGGRRSAGSRPSALSDADGALTGPFNAMLRQPVIGQALQSLGSALRFEGSLSDRCRELSILAVAAHWSCEYEQFSHEPLASRLGISDDVIAGIRDGRTEIVLGDEREHAALEAAQALTARGDLSDAEFDLATRVLGEEALFELLTLVGYYASLALQLRVYRVPAPSIDQ